MGLTKEELAERCMMFEDQNTALACARGLNEINGMRFALASQYCIGRGIEVGAGNRPFPLPPGSIAMYGDSRDHAELKEYFGSQVDMVQSHIDAETFDGVEKNSADFIISAHVIEHLLDPIGSIQAISTTLKFGGHAIVVAPEMTQTFDHDRPVTTLQHVMSDYEDGGRSTRLQAYIEHVRFVHPLYNTPIPDHLVDLEARKIMEARMDIHVHAWNRSAFIQMIEAACEKFGLQIVAAVSLWNENAVVVKKMSNNRWFPTRRISSLAKV